MKKIVAAVAGCLLACCLGVVAHARQPYSEESIPPNPMPPAPKPALPRDPTQPASPQMRSLFTAPAATTPGGPIAAPAMPTLALRSRVIGIDGTGAATIDVDNARLLVYLDTEFTWSPANGGPPQLLKVTELNGQQVVVEISHLNRKFVLR